MFCSLWFWNRLDSPSRPCMNHSPFHLLTFAPCLTEGPIPPLCPCQMWSILSRCRSRSRSQSCHLWVYGTFGQRFGNTSPILLSRWLNHHLEWNLIQHHMAHSASEEGACLRYIAARKTRQNHGSLFGSTRGLTTPYRILIFSLKRKKVYTESSKGMKFEPLNHQKQTWWLKFDTIWRV